jgi:hypothetical protein
MENLRRECCMLRMSNPHAGLSLKTNGVIAPGDPPELGLPVPQ